MFLLCFDTIYTMIDMDIQVPLPFAAAAGTDEYLAATYEDMAAFQQILRHSYVQLRTDNPTLYNRVTSQCSKRAVRMALESKAIPFETFTVHLMGSYVSYLALSRNNQGRLPTLTQGGINICEALYPETNEDEDENIGYGFMLGRDQHLAAVATSLQEYCALNETNTQTLCNAVGMVSFLFNATAVVSN